MFPQLGAPVGLLLSGTIFQLLNSFMSDEAFLSYGWRIPFLASGVLVWVGLYVRLKITETPEFQQVVRNHGQVRVPSLSILREYPNRLVAGIFASASSACFACNASCTTSLGMSA